MSLNSLKKMLVFNSERTKTIVESMAADEAAVEKRSTSAVIENHILHDLFPKNKNATFWLEIFYENGRDKANIGDLLHSCFSYLAAGINCEAKHDNALELVELAYNFECVSHNRINPKADEIYHFLSQLDSVALILAAAAEKGNATHDVKKEAEWARQLCDKATKDHSFIAFLEIYQLLLNNWELLKKYSSTYRLLADMTVLQEKWPATPAARCNVIQALTRVSAEWND